MNLLPVTDTFLIEGVEYHCRPLPADFQSSPERREKNSSWASQFVTYYASTCGHIVSVKADGSARVLKSWDRQADCPRQRVELKIDGKRTKQYVHRLVALTYLTNYGELDADGNARVEVNHITPDVTMNAIRNLEFASQEENDRHYKEHVPAWAEERESARV